MMMTDVVFKLFDISLKMVLVMYTCINIYQNKLFWCDFCDRQVITSEIRIEQWAPLHCFQAVLYFQTALAYRILCTDNAL